MYYSFRGPIVGIFPGVGVIKTAGKIPGPDSLLSPLLSMHHMLPYHVLLKPILYVYILNI